MAPIPHATQRAVRRDRQSGYYPAAIASSRGLPLESVKQILSHTYQNEPVTVTNKWSLRETGLEMLEGAKRERHIHDRVVQIRAVRGNFCDAPGLNHWRENN